MFLLKEVREDLKKIKTIKTLTNIYHQVANLRMKEIREKVLKTRKFFEELLSIYQKVKESGSLTKKGSIKKETFQTNKEKLAVFLSANQFFYGPLILEIWSKTISFIKKEKSDLAIIGKMGKYLAESRNLKNNFFYFDLNDENPKEKEISAIVEFIKNYKKIIIFYGRYKSVLSQKAVMSNISEIPLIESRKKIKKYLFEPSTEAIVEFFEREIITTLFYQCILEHQLARYAARVIAMYKAREKAKEEEKKLKIRESNLKAGKFNKEQIDFFGKTRKLFLRYEKKG